MNVLEARGVSVTPPGAHEPTVEGISLSVARGEWVALTGPNAGGKSSLLLGLSGLWPARGEILLQGGPLPAADRPGRQGIAVILQDPSSQVLQPTVFDEIAFGLRNAGARESLVEERVMGIARDLGLRAELAADPARLSAGRQQLVLLAAALAQGPSLLLADEPTAHLDGASRRVVLDRLKAGVAKGMAVLWVTQLPEELAHADRAIKIGRRPNRSAEAMGHDPVLVAEPLLRLRVAPLGMSEGPRVLADQELEIVVASRGVTAILGPNGAGKSVLLAAAAGLDAPTQVATDWVSTPEPAPIAALQFPELQIFEELVADELAFAAVSRGLTRQQALDHALILLGELGLNGEALLARRTWSLAAGEKRLLEIVAALVAPAVLWVLDEPTAGLDPERREALGRVVRQISARHPVLVASQDREWVESVGSRSFVLPLSSQGMSEA